MKTAVVLMAHGSRHAAANEDLVALAEDLRRTGERHGVYASFLELAEPDIESACRRAVADGAERVVMMPYFLSAGVHVLRDLTAIRERLAGEYPTATFVLAEPLGRHPLLQAVVRARIDEALA